MRPLSSIYISNYTYVNVNAAPPPQAVAQLAMYQDGFNQSINRYTMIFVV